MVTITYDTQVRLQCRERIVRNLRLSRRYDRKQSRLSGIRKTYQPHICQQLQLQDDFAFLSRFARLSITGSLVGRCLEMPVALSATTTFQQHNFLSVFGHVADIFAGFGIIYYSSARHFDHPVFTVFPETALGTTAFAVRCHDMTFELQMQEGPVIPIATKIHMASSPSVASVGASFRNIFLTTKVRGPSSALSRAAIDLYVIYKV